MCKQDYKIHLCTCSNVSSSGIKNILEDDLIKLKRNQTFNLIKWKLNRFMRNEWIGLDGLLFKPTDKLTTQITSVFLQDEMNLRNCFDFNYTPKQGDNIIFELEVINKNGKPIKNQSVNKFISLIYKNSKWNIDWYDPFYNTTEGIYKGIVKIQ